MQTLIIKATGFVKAVVHADKSREYWTVAGTLSVIGSWFATLLGGWDAGLKTLLVLFGVDIFLGVLLAVMRKSSKSESHGLSSTSFWVGLCKKIASLGLIAGATAIESFMGTTFIRDAVIISYIAGEAISLAENLALMGVPIPEKWKQVIDVLAKKADQSGAEQKKGE